MTQPTLRQLQWQACKQIDRKAEEMRLLILTDLAGQQTVYERKRVEAHAYLQAVQAGPGAVAGPYLQAEADRCAMPVLDVATRVLAAASAEDLVGPAIEAERVGGKLDVRAALEPGGVAIALASCLAALQATTQLLE